MLHAGKNMWIDGFTWNMHVLFSNSRIQSFSLWCISILCSESSAFAVIALANVFRMSLALAMATVCYTFAGKFLFVIKKVNMLVIIQWIKLFVSNFFNFYCNSCPFSILVCSYCLVVAAWNLNFIGEPVSLLKLNISYFLCNFYFQWLIQIHHIRTVISPGEE